MGVYFARQVHSMINAIDNFDEGGWGEHLQRIFNMGVYFANTGTLSELLTSPPFVSLTTAAIIVL